MYHIFLIHSLIEGHLDCLQFLLIMNRTIINMVEQLSLGLDELSFDYITVEQSLCTANIYYSFWLIEMTGL